MNDKLQPIFARRSVRRYTQDAIADGVIRDLLAAAMAAPSAVAKDPWDFFIVRDQAARGRIADVLPNGQMLRQAPVGIVVTGSLERVHDGQLSYLLQDCGAAIENLLLAASILGLGACWLGVHPREERVAGVREILSLPERTIPVGAVSIGWPAEKPSARTRYREERVHWD